ncbi:ABC transporter permease [Clostridium oceanicum]|uniref:ABC transporter permease n=1 Tax=Clostridium oceanicum TaxID=1543 RepID=A0ABN1JLR9_9CLOT
MIKVNTVKEKFIKFKHHPQIIIGGVILIIIFLAAVFAPILTKYNPLEVIAKDRLKGPSLIHIMGTDEYGRDVFCRLLFGARISIKIGICVTVLSTIFGVLIGVIAGYYKKVDNIVMRIIDGLMAFPSIIIAITLCAIGGAGTSNIIFALTFAYFPTMVRITRGSVITIKEWECVESARAIGAKDRYIIFKYIIRNALSPIIVQETFIFAWAILDEAALSFLGVGIEAPNPSWGIMVTEARKFMEIAPWQILCPGIAIIATVLGLNLLGDGFRDMLDPKLK